MVLVLTESLRDVGIFNDIEDGLRLLLQPLVR